MNTKRFALSCLAVYVVYQILGYLIHQVWLAPTYQQLAHIWRPESELSSKMWIMFVTSAVWTVMFVYIFVKGYEARGLMEGVRYGAIIGIFFAIPQAYDNYAILPIPYSLALRWFLSGLAGSLVLGVIVAAIYRRE